MKCFAVNYTGGIASYVFSTLLDISRRAIFRPHRRGSECIKYVDNNYTYWLLSFFVSFQISATEIIQAKLNKIPAKIKLQLFGYAIPVWIDNAYRQIGIYAFGSAASQLTTDIAKYTIGRLRPHFFSVSINHLIHLWNLHQHVYMAHCGRIEWCCAKGQWRSHGRGYT